MNPSIRFDADEDRNFQVLSEDGDRIVCRGHRRSVRIEGRELDAECLYEEAIESARANGFIHNEAIAYELAARFYAARRFKQIADLYLRSARYGYLRLGADGSGRGYATVGRR